MHYSHDHQPELHLGKIQNISVDLWYKKMTVITSWLIFWCKLVPVEIQ